MIFDFGMILEPFNCYALIEPKNYPFTIRARDAFTTDFEFKLYGLIVNLYMFEWELIICTAWKPHLLSYLNRNNSIPFDFIGQKPWNQCPLSCRLSLGFPGGAPTNAIYMVVGLVVRGSCPPQGRLKWIGCPDHCVDNGVLAGWGLLSDVPFLMLN